MTADIVMEEQPQEHKMVPEKKASKKRKSAAAEVQVESENTTQPTNPAAAPSKKEKKKKASQDKKSTTNDDADAENPTKKKSKQSADAAADHDLEQLVNTDALSPIAHPLADKKMTKRVLRTVKKGSISTCNFFRLFIKSIILKLCSSQPAYWSISPHHAPIFIRCKTETNQEGCEGSGEGVTKRRERESLGAASSTKRPTSCVMISHSKGGSEAMQKKFSEKKKALVAADPSKAAKIQADEDEYTASFEAVLGEVLQLRSRGYSAGRGTFVILRNVSALEDLIKPHEVGKS
ncbi:hypothetical protein VP01_387g9 [Puccinia sorghi]|uniref:Uncharacterized protein n=1 Tax=Puccinia sorghi TaxID=27349 RepID=A0A0L6UT04_9BASI|nr:hypothetical protein VP01_387g9 [Puccinia sorghi]